MDEAVEEECATSERHEDVPEEVLPAKQQRDDPPEPHSHL